MASSVKELPDGAGLRVRLARLYDRGVPVPLLTCPVCAEQTVLPYRIPKGAALPEPYWPDEENLALVCDRCGHFRKFSPKDLTWIPELAASAARAFWRVEIPCSVLLCPESIVAHIQTFGTTSRSAIGVAIAQAQPTPQCALHHGPNSVPYPSRIDFVEWAGGEEYVV